MTDIVTGAALPYLGRAVFVNVTDAAVLAVRVSLDGNMLAIAVPHRLGGNGRTAAIRGALVNWYRGIAAEHLRRSVEHWAEVMQVTPGRVLVRDQRRRWGSCAPDGTLRFNWRIIMTDEAVFEYVVVHELAHLAHRDHGQDFWAAVGRVIPDHRARRRKLREAGASLPL